MKSFSFLFLFLVLLSTRAHAARDFVRASNQYLSRSAVVTALPITISAWFRTSNVTDNQVLVGLMAGTTGGYYLTIRGVTAGDPLSASVYDGTTSAHTLSGGSVTTGTWMHGCAVYSTTTSRAVYLDGAKATNTTAVTITGVDTTIIGAYASANSVVDGQLAEVAIWNVALSDDEVAALARGISPLRVRPSALVDYWPLTGNGTTEPGVRGNALTNSGSTKSELHPRTYRSE